MGIPLEEQERKEILYPFLIHLLNRYIVFILNSELSLNSTDIISLDSTDIISDKKDEKLRKECIDISIEFCIEIQARDYLLKEVERTFARTGKSDLFFKSLESYIFRDLLFKKNFGIDSLNSLYSSYKIKNELIILSHLFTHINIICINNFALQKMAINENLLDLIIYFC